MPLEIKSSATSTSEVSHSQRRCNPSHLVPSKALSLPSVATKTQEDRCQLQAWLFELLLHCGIYLFGAEVSTCNVAVESVETGGVPV